MFLNGTFAEEKEKVTSTLLQHHPGHAVRLSVERYDTRYYKPHFSDMVCVTALSGLIDVNCWFLLYPPAGLFLSFMYYAQNGLITMRVKPMHKKSIQLCQLMTLLSVVPNWVLTSLKYCTKKMYTKKSRK